MDSEILDQTPIFIEYGEYSDYRVWGVMFVEDGKKGEAKDVLEKCQGEFDGEQNAIWDKAGKFALQHGVEPDRAWNPDNWPSKELYEKYGAICDEGEDVEKVRPRVERELKAVGIEYKMHPYEEWFNSDQWE